MYLIVQNHIQCENSSAISAMNCFAKGIICCCCNFDVVCAIIILNANIHFNAYIKIIEKTYIKG